VVIGFGVGAGVGVVIGFGVGAGVGVVVGFGVGADVGGGITFPGTQFSSTSQTSPATVHLGVNLYLPLIHANVEKHPLPGLHCESSVHLHSSSGITSKAHCPGTRNPGEKFGAHWKVKQSLFSGGNGSTKRSHGRCERPV
jgi:hypothetical protein